MVIVNPAPAVTRRRVLATGLAGVAGVALACAPAASPADPAPQPSVAPVGTAVPTATPAPRQLFYVFSNSSPHVSVVDAATNTVTATKDVPGLKTWTWNDDYNHGDGKLLWLGTRDPSNDDVEVLTLDLDSLEVTHRIPLGKDKTTLYIGQASKKGVLLVAKHASGQLASIDLKTLQLQDIKDVPVNGGVACDVDVATGPDGVERGFVPTLHGDTVVSVDTPARNVLVSVDVPRGSRPVMLTAAPDGKTVWVQDASTNTQSVFPLTACCQPADMLPACRHAASLMAGCQREAVQTQQKAAAAEDVAAVDKGYGSDESARTPARRRNPRAGGRGRWRDLRRRGRAARPGAGPSGRPP